MAKEIKSFLKVNLKIDTCSRKYFKKQSLEVKTLDISLLGLGVLSKHFIPKGAIVDLQLNIDNKIIKIKGQIRAAISSAKGLTRLGIKFIGLTKPQLKIMKNFIRKNERRNPTRMKLT